MSFLISLYSVILNLFQDPPLQSKHNQSFNRKWMLKRVQDDGLILTLTVFLSLPLSAENFAVTSTSLFSEKNAGSVTDVLTAKEIEETQSPFAADQLQRLPSLDISPYGPSGRTVEYTMRGARSGQNAVFLDGIPLNNPASGGKFDFADFLIDDLEEIEVLPGANSVIYGADALGGVINLKTKRGRGNPRGLAKGGLGNFKTRQGHIEAQGEFHDIDFYTGGTGYQSGHGTFKNKIHDTTQSDYYRNSTVTASLGATPNDDLDLWGFVRQSTANLKFDGYTQNFLPEAADNFSQTHTNVGGLHGDLNTFEGVWEHHIVLGMAKTERNTQTPSYLAHSDGRDYRLKYYQDLNLADWNTTTIGTDLGHETAEDSYVGKNDRNHHALFGQEKFRLFRGNELTTGLRYDQYSKGGERVSYRLGASQSFGDSRVRSSLGTGFKPPVLSDIFNNTGFSIPNPNLRPETNKSFDIGFDHKIGESFEFHLTGFINIIDHVIISRQDQNFKFQRVNAGRRYARGIENEIKFRPFEILELRSTTTLTHAKDQHLGKRAPGIPYAKGTFETLLKPLKSVQLFSGLTYKGTQMDAVTSHKLRPYVTLNLGGKYNFYEHVSLFGRVENLTDRRYEEVYGFGTRGRLFLVGVEVKS